ncbi:MAG: BON domain-containing protein [Alphaproteobacteria bacterium]|nr:BON domain-containing protein [Alphaproteobacteria bacterium]
MLPAGPPPRLRVLLRALLLPLVLFAAGCSPYGLAIGAGATAAVTVLQERSVEDAAKDATIQFMLNERLFATDLDLFGDTTVIAVEGRVLITGTTRTREHIEEVSRLAWTIPEVREVFNEVKFIAHEPGLDFGRDTSILAQLRAALLRDRVINEINYSVTVNLGTVYIMGIAYQQAELDRVIAYARDIRGVRAVVSHALLKDDPRRRRAYQ